MKNLKADILAYSRLTSEDRNFRNVDLNIIIEEVKEELREVIKEKNAIIEARELCSVYVIPLQLQHLLLNLLSNSLRFSKPGHPPHIVIESVNIITSKANAHNLNPGKEYCHISIKDNGIGFEPEYKARVLELFQGSKEKDESEDLGIGISIVKKIVDNHNGKIIVTSEPNEGTIFDIYIPVGTEELV
jgi:two-component system, chemotaxis family, CheB/CheR fusion protein